MKMQIPVTDEMSEEQVEIMTTINRKIEREVYRDLAETIFLPFKRTGIAYGTMPSHFLPYMLERLSRIMSDIPPDRLKAAGSKPIQVILTKSKYGSIYFKLKGCGIRPNFFLMRTKGDVVRFSSRDA